MKQTKKLSMLFAILTLALVLLVGCQAYDKTSVDYKYYSQDQLHSTIENASPVVIFDVQVEADYNAHHIDGAVATYAFPVKSDADKAKIDAQFQVLEETDSDIVIICPMGRIGAERTYVYLLEKGIAPERLFILEGGQAGWTSDAGETNTLDNQNDSEDSDSSADT